MSTAINRRVVIFSCSPFFPPNIFSQLESETMRKKMKKETNQFLVDLRKLFEKYNVCMGYYDQEVQ
jgi:hypothetical protein